MTVNRKLILLFILNFYFLTAGEVLVLHENVGAEIDIIEKVHYRLFPDIDNFINAQFYLLPNDSVMANIQCWNANGIYYRKHYYSQYEFYLLGQEVGQREPPDRGKGSRRTGIKLNFCRENTNPSLPRNI